MKTMWEKCDKFKVALEFNVPSLRLPQERDMWIMKVFEQKGFSADDLEWLNKVRLHQQVLFLSCVLGATGKSLDMKYMSQKKDTEVWSTIKVVQERPLRRDFCLWRMALRQVAPAGGIQDRLGRLTHSGYKVWNRRYDLENERLLHAVDGKTDMYTPSNLPRMIGTANRWTRSLIGQDIEPTGQVCTVRDV